MKLSELKKSRNMSYTKIGKALNMERSTIFRIVNSPWRTCLESFLKVASFFELPEHEAKKEWLKSKTEFQKTKNDYKIKQLKMQANIDEKVDNDEKG